VADGMEPDKFFDKFIIGGKVRELATLKNELGADNEAWQAMRGQLVAYLKQKGGVSEDAGTFNSSSFNNALRSLGNEKLKVFFSPQELDRLQAISRVARYEQVQPRGSAVNNSNSAPTAANLVGRAFDAIVGTKMPIVGPAIGRVVGSAARDVAQSANIKVQAGQAANVPSALALAPPKATDAPMLSPALAALLAAPDEKRKSGAK
jgi:hypothetical protein